MKKILSLIISICFMTQSKSQEQKEFVEIVAEDTLHVEPEEIFYVVMLSSSYANSDTVFMENTPPVKINTVKIDSRVDRLNKLISQMQIDTMVVNELNIIDGYAESDKTMLLHFYSKTKLEAFVREAKKNRSPYRNDNRSSKICHFPYC